MARRSGPLSRDPCTRIDPEINAVRIASGVRVVNTSGLGARAFSMPEWHAAQRCLKRAPPSGVVCCAKQTVTLNSTSHRMARSYHNRCIRHRLKDMASENRVPLRLLLVAAALAPGVVLGQAHESASKGAVLVYTRNGKGY